MAETTLLTFPARTRDATPGMTSGRPHARLFGPLPVIRAGGGALTRVVPQALPPVQTTVSGNSQRPALPAVQSRGNATSQKRLPGKSPQVPPTVRVEMISGASKILAPAKPTVDVGPLRARSYGADGYDLLAAAPELACALHTGNVDLLSRIVDVVASASCFVDGSPPRRWTWIGMLEPQSDKPDAATVMTAVATQGACRQSSVLPVVLKSFEHGDVVVHYCATLAEAVEASPTELRDEITAQLRPLRGR